MEYNIISLDVHYGDCGPDGHMRPLSILRISQEAGLRHAAQMGMSIMDPHAAGVLLFTTRMHIAFYEPLPHWQETITIKTWVSEMKKVRAFRAYEMRGGDGRVTARAMLDGVLVDAKTRKPIRFDIGYHIPVVGKGETIAPPDRIGPLADAAYAGERHAEWYQTDTNGHINNMRHAELALSALPEEYRERPIHDWTINYLAELAPGQRIKLYCHVPEDGVVMTEGRDDEGSAVFRSRIQFSPPCD